MKEAKSILIISDLHAPYTHVDTVDFLKYIKGMYKPTHIVGIGDEIDAHAISYHEKHPDLPGAEDEFEKAIETLKPIYKLFPEVSVMESNHGSLVYRKGKTAGLPSRVFKDYGDIIEAPKGWKWYSDLILKTALGEVYFCHGKTSSLGKLSTLYGMSTVVGHFHSKANIVYTSNPNNLIFDMFVGCLIDDKSKAMAYNKLTPARPIISCGVIIDGIPQIVPMVLNKKGRWVGR